MNFRCNKKPNESPLYFDISTSDVKWFLTNKKFKMIADAKRKAGVANPEEIEVQVTGNKYGTNFIPFSVVMPISVLNIASVDPNRPSVFNPDKDGVQLKKEYESLIRNYAFDKDDIEELNRPQMRKELGITKPKLIAEIKRYSTPKYEKDGVEFVLMLMSPSKIFRDMLYDNDNKNQRYSIEIVDYRKGRETGEYIFTVKRTIEKQSKHYNDNLSAIAKKMAENLAK